MAETPEELALDLSQASREAQVQTENQLREKATTVLSAASIVVPIAGVAVIPHGPTGAGVAFGVAGVAYFLCARACGAALLPTDIQAGLLGGQMLDVARKSGADLRQMQASSASYLDQGYRRNQTILESSAGRIRVAIVALVAEILALIVAVGITIAS